MFLLFAILQFFVRRNNDIWLYSEGQQRSCSHFLVENRTMDSRRHIYLTSNQLHAKNLLDMGIEVYSANSLKAKWLSIRAGVWIVCTSRFEELNRWLSYRVKIINIWHGIPLKSIGLDTYNVDTWKKSEFKRQRNMRRQSRKYQNVSFLCATSPFVQSLFSSSFAKPKQDLPIVGEPRNDYLIKNQGDRSNLINRYGDLFASAHKVFVYMPTFRDYGKWETKLNYNQLNSFLAEHNAVMLIRAHPTDKNLKDISQHFSRIYESKPQAGSWNDAYEELVGADFLITDYSSLMFEFLLTDQPILLYQPDRLRYENSRHFCVDFDAVKPSDSITEFSGLLDAMANCLGGNFDSSQQTKSKALMHSVTDASSSQRVHRAICEQLR